MNRNEALAIICSWQWECYDYDTGKPMLQTRPLSDVVNQLAMCGDNDPPETVLALLAEGRLSAKGSWRWRAYKGYEHYENSGEGVIPATRWQELSYIKGEFARLRFDEEAYQSTVNLPELGFGETEKYNWDWRCHRMSFASVKDGGWLGISEEHFSTWAIEIVAPEESIAPQPTLQPTSPTLAKIPNGGGRPPKLDWEAVALELAGQYYRGDFKPKTIAEVVEAIQHWANRPDGGPDKSTVYPHAKTIFDAFKSWETDL